MFKTRSLSSGVGPADHLEEMGIPLVMNLSVGYNLQDHLGTPVVFKVMPRNYYNRTKRITKGLHASIVDVPGLAACDDNVGGDRERGDRPGVCPAFGVRPPHVTRRSEHVPPRPLSNVPPGSTDVLVAGIETIAFLNSTFVPPGVDYPDVELHLVSSFPGLTNVEELWFGLGLILHPQSRGRVTLQSR